MVSRKQHVLNVRMAVCLAAIAGLVALAPATAAEPSTARSSTPTTRCGKSRRRGR